MNSYKSLLLFGFLASACTNGTTKSEDTSADDSDTGIPTEDTDTSSEPGNEPSEPGNEPSEPGNEPSEEPAPLVIEEGSYAFSNIQEVSDVCGVGNWAPEPVTSFVPDDMVISNSSEGQFTIDGSSVCTRSGADGLAFDCQSQTFMEVSDSALGEVTLEIENRLSGSITSESSLDVRLDVTLIECTNNFIACPAMGLALGGFPCLIELDSVASQ